QRPAGPDAGGRARRNDRAGVGRGRMRAMAEVTWFRVVADIPELTAMEGDRLRIEALAADGAACVELYRRVDLPSMMDVARAVVAGRIKNIDDTPAQVSRPHLMVMK